MGRPLRLPAERILHRAALILAACASVQAAFLGSQARAQEPAPTVENRIVQVDGVPMSLHLSGAGYIAIILEAGSGGDHRTWAAVQPRLSALGRVVSYDRLDYGASGRSSRARTAAVVAEQLREGLRSAGVQPPFLIVGHSYGGALARVFAARYRDEVVGMVLVDPAMEDFYPRATVEASRDYLAQLERDLEGDDRNASEALRREYLAYETSMVQARLASPLPGDRIILLSATQMDLAEPLRRVWLDEQARWAASVGARLVRVDSGHNIHRRRPEAVIDAVRTLLSPLPAAGTLAGR